MSINIKFWTLLVLLFPTCVCAQVENDERLVESISAQTKRDSVIILERTIDELKGQVRELTDSLNHLKRQALVYKQAIKNKDDKISQLEDRLIFADSVVARLSNDCLRKKYDPLYVENAIANFNHMYSPELKRKFGQLKVLLNKYGQYTQEIVIILTEAQNDKELFNPFTGQKRAALYIDKIKATQYYQEAYKRNWTIPYLNDLIDKCFEKLKAFDPVEMTELNLLELMK